MTRFLTVAVVVLLALVILALTGRKSVYAELTVQASPDAVWQILMDTPSYGEWHPVMVSVTGTFAAGGTMDYLLQMGPGEPSPAQTKTVELVEGERLNQFGGYRGILTYDHVWELQPTDSGTRVIQRETYRGIYVWFWDPAEVENLYQLALEQLAERLAANDSAN